MMKYLYDATLDVCPICKDSWYTEEDGYYRIDCKCGIRTPCFLSRKSAKIYWYKFLCIGSILNDN
jgi:hypothetical protein